MTSSDSARSGDLFSLLLLLQGLRFFRLAGRRFHRLVRDIVHLVRMGRGQLDLRGEEFNLLISPVSGSRRDQTAHNHVLFESPQMIDFSRNRGLGQNPGGFLE